MEQRYLTASAIDAYARCEHLYYLQYVAGMSRVGYASALVVGSAVHAAGEALRRGGALHDAIADARCVVIAAVDAAETYADDIESLHRQAATDTARIVAMISGMHECMTAISTPQNEVIMQARLRCPDTGRASRTFRLRGIADAIVNRDGATYVYEMKTTSDTIHDCMDWLRQSVQIPLYWYLYRETHGVDVAGTIVDVIKKPTIRRRTSGKNAETVNQWRDRCIDAYRADPERYFHREIIDYDQRRERETLRIAWNVGERIKMIERTSGEYLACRGNRCKGKYGDCRYKTLCWWGDMRGYEMDTDRRYDGVE